MGKPSSRASRLLASSANTYKDSTCSTAIPDLNVCSQPASAVEWGIFQLYFMSQYAVIAQQNYARATRYSTVYPANSLAVLINETLGASTTAQVLRAVGLLGNSSSTAATCVDWAGVRAREQANVDPVDNSWFYILCRDLPLSLFAVRPGNTLFPPLSPDIDLASTSCGFVGEDWVTPDLYASNARWEEKYNITDAVLDEVRRLVITQGTFDRISAVGTPNLSRPTSDRNQSRVITVTGMAHVESAVSETLIPRGLRPQVDEVGFARAMQQRRLSGRSANVAAIRFETRSLPISRSGSVSQISRFRAAAVTTVLRPRPLPGQIEMLMARPESVAHLVQHILDMVVLHRAAAMAPAIGPVCHGIGRPNVLECLLVIGSHLVVSLLLAGPNHPAGVLPDRKK